jgi:histidine triad (HIT) family protein
MSADGPSIFTRIVHGEIPCHRVYEDEHVLAFLDIGPLAPGHLLLIPKTEYRTLDQVPPETAAALGAALPKLVAAVQQATGSAGVNILQNNGQVAGQEVLHVHFHIILAQKATAWATAGNPSPTPKAKPNKCGTNS